MTSRGPLPKWDIPMRWEGIRVNDLNHLSVEISIWSQERFRKTMIGFVKLHSGEARFDRTIKWADATKVERSCWDAFLQKPTKLHHFRLPLRPATNEKK
jgi:hypothetical protein